MSGTLVTGRVAAKHLGIGYRTFEKLRKAEHPLFQPTVTDPDSDRRRYDLMEMDEARAELGRIKARSAT